MAKARMTEDEMNEQFAEKLVGKSSNTEEAKIKQRKREVKIAMYLREKIQAVADGTESMDDFGAKAQMEALKIAEGSFGSTFLTTVGFQLEVEAEEYIGFSNSFLGLNRHKASAKKNASNVSANLKITGAAIKAANAGRKVYKEVESAQLATMENNAPKTTVVDSDGKVSDNQGKTKKQLEAEQAMLAPEKLEDSLPAILDLAWAVNERDISRTLKNSCTKVLSDASVELEKRMERAKALKILGHEFHTIGKLVVAESNPNAANTKESIKARAEVAVMTTMAKVCTRMPFPDMSYYVICTQV